MVSESDSFTRIEEGGEFGVESCFQRPQQIFPYMPRERLYKVVVANPNNKGPTIETTEGICDKAA